MPLIRPSTDTTDAAAPALLTQRRVPPAESEIDRRRHAARNLSHDPAALANIATLLESEPDPRVRDALFSSIVDIGGMSAAELLARLLRSEDAGLRGAAIESLKRLDTDAVIVLDGLLSDPDTDVRILAVEVTRAWPRDLAAPRLRRVFEREPHVNVCAAAVDVATEVGTEELLPDLGALRARFADQPFLGFAIDVACDRIRGARCE
jgi:HEAT repeat protein